MAGSDPASDERAATRLRQRLWGAAVLIALAVIVLPLLLDGAGSESRFRRVEKLREEPPRIVRPSGEVVVEEGAIARDTLGSDSVGRIDEAGAEPGGAVTVSPDAANDDAPASPEGAASSGGAPDARVGTARDESTAGVTGGGGASGDATPPRAWAVQAGSFRDRENALAVLDRLRREGHASFVTDVDRAGERWYRVLAGPMADEQHAGRLREKVASLLGREVIVVAYP